MFSLADFLTYVLVSSITPGPNTLMSLENGRRKGVRRGITLNLGMLCGLTVVLTACLLFSAALLDYLPVFRPVMKILGAAYILWLAWKTLRRTGAVEGRDPGTGGFLAGLCFQFINPKLYVYGITSISNFILPYFDGLPARWGMTMALVGVSFVCGVIWLACGAALAGFLNRYEKPSNAVLAALLVYCAYKIMIA